MPRTRRDGLHSGAVRRYVHMTQRKPDTLKALRRAARRKADADTAFRAALEAADADGQSYAAMAEAARTSRQRVRQLLTYKPR